MTFRRISAFTVIIFMMFTQSIAQATSICWDGTTPPVGQICPPYPAPTIACYDGSMVYSYDECPVVCVGGGWASSLDQCPANLAMAPDIAASGDLCFGDINFVIYFGLNSADLTTDAMTVIKNAAQQALQCSILDVIIEGHTDSSGAASYNANLAHRRALATEHEIIIGGITARIIVASKGENALHIPTGNGVNEPLNRRTEVVIKLSAERN